MGAKNGIPLAAGVFINILDWKLNPMFEAAAMSLSSVCVVSNALRLNFVKIHSELKEHNHVDNLAIVTLEKEIAEEEFRKVVESCDYKFLGIK